MQKWEYCAIGRLQWGRGKDDEGDTTAIFPGPESKASLAFMTSQGIKVSHVIHSSDELGRTIASLGADGWELTGCGSVGTGSVGGGGTSVHMSIGGEVDFYHFLYFKRPKE